MKIFNSSGTMAITSVVTGVSSEAVDVSTAGSFGIVSNVTVDTNSAKVFAAGSVASNHVTITAHAYKNGLVGQLTTAGSLPTGLSTSTNYYIIVVDANTVSFASSYANAIAGTAIAITGGSGNSTFTPTSLAGASVVGQWSLDNSVWVTDGAVTNITVSASIGFKVDRPAYRYYRLTYAITSGSLTLANTYVVNKDS